MLCCNQQNKTLSHGHTQYSIIVHTLPSTATIPCTTFGSPTFQMCAGDHPTPRLGGNEGRQGDGGTGNKNVGEQEQRGAKARGVIACTGCCEEKRYMCCGRVDGGCNGACRDEGCGVKGMVIGVSVTRTC